MDPLHSIVAFLAAHPVECLVLATTVVNLLLARVSPEQLVAMASRQPMLAGTVTALRAAGVDIPGLIRAAQVALAAKAAQSAASRVAEVAAKGGE